MNVQELINILEGVRFEQGDHVEVRLAIQPSWPFEHSIAGTKLWSPHTEDLRECEEMILTETDPDEVKKLRERIEFLQEEVANSEILYLTEGGQIGYTTDKLWD